MPLLMMFGKLTAMALSVVGRYWGVDLTPKLPRSHVLANRIHA